MQVRVVSMRKDTAGRACGTFELAVSDASGEVLDDTVLKVEACIAGES